MPPAGAVAPRRLTRHTELISLAPQVKAFEPAHLEQQLSAQVQTSELDAVLGQYNLLVTAVATVAVLSDHTRRRRADPIGVAAVHRVEQSADDARARGGRKAQLNASRH